MFAYFRAPLGWFEICKRTIAEAGSDGCVGLAAQLGFYFLLALFPALIFLIALVAFIPVRPAIDTVLTGLAQLAPSDVVAVVRRSGIGVYGLAVFATGFLLIVLWIVESFEPSPKQEFILEIKAKHIAGLQPKLEALLRRRRIRYELRESTPEEVSYQVQMPMDVKTDTVSADIIALDPGPGTGVEWKTEKKQTG